MATVPSLEVPFFPFPTSSGKALGVGEITSNATSLPYFNLCFQLVSLVY